MTPVTCRNPNLTPRLGRLTRRQVGIALGVIWPTRWAEIGAHRNAYASIAAMELLELENDGVVRTINLDGARVTIGRGDGNDVVVDGDGTVSREHAVLEKTGGRWHIIDLRSRNGTFVNGQAVKEPIALESGDKIKIGHAGLTLATDATETARVVMDDVRHAIDRGNVRVSVRQRKMLELLVSGLTDDEIARQMRSRTRDIEAELAILAEKTGARDRVDLARVAAQLGAV